MTAADPFLPLRDWRSSLFRGDAAAIDQFLDKIDATVPSSWGRDIRYEQTRLEPSRVRCYLFDGAGDAAVRVWLQRVTRHRVRGGPVQVLRHSSSGNAALIGNLVSDFFDSCVLPAAQACNVRRTSPTFGPRSAMTPSADMLFIRLADTAEGHWPLKEEAQSLWDELISTCLADQVAIDRDELRQWLADSGWDQAAVAKIAEQFFAESEWLARRLGATTP